MNTRKEEDGEDEIIEFDEFLKSLSITARGTLEEKLSCKSKLKYQRCPCHMDLVIKLVYLKI